MSGGFDLSSDEKEKRPAGGSPIFATTHWSVVLAAAGQHSAEASAALDRLCQTYWYPLYAYVRRRGYSPHDAEDLTQGFFAQLLERGALQRLSPAKGKFRSFLLSSLTYFLSDQFDRREALKRGGGKVIISLEAKADEMYQGEPKDSLSPDMIFERRWALALLDQALGRLRMEYAANGKGAQFERLFGFLIDAGTGSYADAARDLQQNENWVKKTMQRMRERYYAIFRDEVAHTVESPALIDEELRYLCKVMADQRQTPGG